MMKVGIAVYCTFCGKRKCPRGRSAPLGMSACFDDCYGYQEEPKVGDLWPGETEEEFGYPVSANGTREEEPNETQRG